MAKIRIVLLALALATAGCSSGGSTDSGAADPGDDPSSESSAPPSEDGGGVGGGIECDQGAYTDEVDAAPVEDEPSDIEVTTAEGVVIRAHWFPAGGDDPAPTVLMGPGWSLAGDTSTEPSEGPVLFGALGIAEMNDAGLNVLTWDPRGFGHSTGAVSINGPDEEGHDVRVLLDWVASQPEAMLDDEGDPRVGMIGASYGGGIQLTVAGQDCRVDALVPNMAWHSLETSLFPNETVKAGWSDRLVTFAADSELDPHIVNAADGAIITGLLDPDDEEWFRSRGPGDLVASITAPTLLLHGTVDTLFTLREAITNFEVLREAGTPVSMVWYCGGHGTCLTEPGPDVLVDATMGWLLHHLAGAEEIELPATVDVVDQDGRRWSGDGLPGEPDGEVTATGPGGTLALTADSAAGPLTEGSSDDLLSGIVNTFTPARATTAVELAVPADGDALVLGAPRLSMTYSGTAPEAPEPTRVFAQLVDDATGFVLGNQITPVPITLDGQPHDVEIELEVVAHHLAAGSGVTLQLVATTPAFATPRLGGELTVTDLSLALPTTEALTSAT